MLIVDAMVEDCVWRISDADDTMTCSSTPPISSVARTFAPAPDVRTTLLETKVLKPESVTVTV